ncbi:hypothetical protein [Lyngbya confervoides]|nr:hypothetical protein [Lyngbya confervoides]
MPPEDDWPAYYWKFGATAEELKAIDYVLTIGSQKPEPPDIAIII